MKVIGVRPAGERETAAFVRRVEGCGLERLKLPVFPPHPQGRALRDARIAARVTLGDAARAIGVKAAALSGIENGRCTFEDEADFSRAAAALEHVAATTHPAGTTRKKERVEL